MAEPIEKRGEIAPGETPDLGEAGEKAAGPPADRLDGQDPGGRMAEATARAFSRAAARLRTSRPRPGV